MSRPGGDPVQRMIAGAVQRFVLDGLDLPALPEGVIVEAHPVGLDTGLVVTTDEGNRYFLVQVREFSTR